MSRELEYPSDISVKKIIGKIDDCFQQIDQWKKTESYDYCAKYLARAEVLIELLEVAHCGSHGGLQIGFPRGHGSLKKRRDYLYKTLVEKE